MTCTENIVHVTPVNALPPLNIGVFFDGTGNDDKRDDELSNVWYLYDMHEGDDEELKNKKYTLRKFYQRGVGSHSGDTIKDWIVDKAGNAGGYGAEVRFENMIFYIETYINEYLTEFGLLPTTIQLDVFGFSRGAAMARHFVNCLKQNYFDFADPEINKAFSSRNILINFLGIYDTVASFGIAGNNADLGFSFHIKQSWIESKAVHIYALNEYRLGFDLQALIPSQDTNYPIDKFEDKFIEIGLPGAHSDIGGGYYYNNKTQHADNSLLACPPLDLMVKYARENGVPLACENTDQARKDAGSAVTDRDYGEMLSSFDYIKPYIEDNDLRAPLGLWREHIALKDIHHKKIENNLPATKRIGRMGNSAKLRQIRYEKSIEKIKVHIELSEKILLEFFETEQDFNTFKHHYDVLYQRYMHRSHSPFNTVTGMWQQDADENTWPWNKTESDDRPHRDIFYNEFKDFEKARTKQISYYTGEVRQSAPVYNILNSVKWDDKELEDVN